MAEIDENSDGVFVSAEIFTDDPNLNIPNYPLSLPSSTTHLNLISLVTQHLKASGKTNDAGLGKKEIERLSENIDFLLDGQLIRGSLAEILEQSLELRSENVLKIEAIQRTPPPEPNLDLPHEDWVSSVIAAPSVIISGSYDQSITVWDRKGSKLSPVNQPKRHSKAVKCLSWINSAGGSNGNKFASGSLDQSIVIWSKSNNGQYETEQELLGHERSVECLMSNADGSRLASGSFDTYLKIWNTDPADQATVHSAKETKKKKSSDIVKSPMVTLSGHNEGIVSVDWGTESNELVTASLDHNILVWDLSVAGHKHRLHCNKALTSVSCEKSTGLLITGSADRVVRLWDLRSKEGSQVKQTFVSHNGWVSSVKWCPNRAHVFVSASYDSVLKVWDARCPKAPLYDLEGHEDRILTCDWSVPDMIASGAVDNTVKTFKTQ